MKPNVPAADANPELARSLARFALLLGVAVGATWGPMLAYFGFRIVPLLGGPATLACLGGILAGGFLGARVPPGYYRLRAWERAGGGRAYERYAGIRRFKRWMSGGDLMNTRIRRHSASYRVVPQSRRGAAAYAVRTREIERAHLAWLLGAVAPLACALAVDAYPFTALWTLLNLVTNVWPILLQRYNRVRAEGVAAGRRGTGG